MTEKKKQEKPDKKMEEKRVKPTIIRRRAVQPVEAEVKEPVKETGPAVAKVTEVAAPEEQIKPAKGKKAGKIAPRQADQAQQSFPYLPAVGRRLARLPHGRQIRKRLLCLSMQQKQLLPD